MNRINVLILVLVLASAACMSPVVTPIAPTPSVTQEAIVLPAADVGGLERVSDNVYVETCTIVAVTDTNIRSCGDVDCEDVGDILAGETVTGACSGDWMTLGRNRYACIPALIGTGGCE